MIFLVPKDVRNWQDLHDSLRHLCDSSDFRRAVRNARDMAREEDEHIIEGFDGRWWPEKDVDFHLRKQKRERKIDFMK